MVEAAGAFAGQHILITGATGGVGSIIAAKMAREGCRITAVSRREDRLGDLKEWVEKLGGKCNTIPRDLADENCYDEIIAEARDTFGFVDAAFWVAARFNPGPFAECDPEEISRTIKLNLISAISQTRAILPEMLERGNGKICAVSSLAGLIPVPYFDIYSSTKAGLMGFFRALAREIKGSGVTVTCVAPRTVYTEIINRLKNLYKRLGWPIDSPEKVAEEIVRATALGKEFVPLGGIEKLAPCLLYIIPGIIEQFADSVKEEMSVFFDRKTDV